MLERHELDTFLTLAEQLHFGRTAELLTVSPARVSQTIAKLERRIGVRLFHRTSRRVELTAAGRELYAELRPAWTAITEAVARATEAGRGVTGTLRVAFVGAAGGQLLVGAAEAFGKQLSGLRGRGPRGAVRRRRTVAGERRGRPGAEHRETDAPGTAQGATLVSEARMLAVALGHPFARRETVSLADVARTTPVEAQATLQEALTLVGAGAGWRRSARRPGATTRGLMWCISRSATRRRCGGACCGTRTARQRGCGPSTTSWTSWCARRADRAQWRKHRRPAAFEARGGSLSPVPCVAGPESPSDGGAPSSAVARMVATAGPGPRLGVRRGVRGLGIGV